MAVSYEFSYKARAFVLGKPFRPSLMFACKAGAYPSEAPFQDRLLASPQTLDQAGKACQGQTLQLFTKICKLRTKKFYNIGLLSQGFKTFHGRKLLVFVISQSISPWQALPAQSYVCGYGRSLSERSTFQRLESSAIKVLHSGRLQLYPQTLFKAGKAFQGQMFQHIMKSRNLRQQKVS